MIHVPASVFSSLPESTEYVTGIKWNIINLIDLVAHVLKTFFQLAHVSILQMLHFSPGTFSNKHFWFIPYSLLEIVIAATAELFALQRSK